MSNNILILGKPGSGKGTQADLICEELNIKQISTGDIFRKNIKEGTELGKLAKSIIDRGEFVPDDVTIDLVKDTLSNEEFKNGFLLDGFPRTMVQAQALKEFLSSSDSKIDKAILIDVEDDEIISRMSNRRVCTNCGATYHLIFNKPTVEGICNKCGDTLVIRNDDKPEVVLDRLETYNKQTAPLIDFYENEKVLIKVNGNQSPKEVGEELKEIL